MRAYSEAVKADVRRRMSPPHRQSVAAIAQELGIHVITLYKWRKAWRLQGEVVPATQKEPRPVPRLQARGPNELWGWDITYLPTSVRGVWLYLYLVIDVWSRKVVAWDVADREDAQIAADLVGRACLRERISKGRRQPLILHADNGNALAAGFSKSCELPRWRADWRSWECSDPSRGRESAMTTPSRNRCSARSSTDRTTPDGPFAARKRPAPGWWHSRVGTTTGIATAPSGS